jgi:hypothetical protein
VRQDHTVPVHVVERRSHDLEIVSEPLLYNLFYNFIYFGHHASPRDNVGYASLASSSLKVHDCFKKPIEMVICCIVKLLKCVEAFG